MRIRLLAVLLTGFCAAAQGADETAPTIVQVQPAAGTVTSLTNVTVTFSEPVSGLSSFDFLVNGQSAEAVSGADETWTFHFSQPTHGTVLISWDLNHTITDDAGNRFNESGPNATWQYNFVDTAAPVVTLLTPTAGIGVRQLTQIEVQFNEGVSGIDAADLLINGTGASSINVLGLGRYLFTFAQPANGTVQVAWAVNHQIRDFASPANAFAGGNWTYTLDPAAGLPDIRISEVVAANATGLRDENAEFQDWIEIQNRGAGVVNLGGWSLTDDPNDPGKWVFPSTNLAAGQYLVVFASGKDRRAPTGTNRFHTNFELSPSGEYLGLFNGESPRLVMTEFAPEFPEQRNDHSYGYDSTNAFKYFSTPTPGAANGASQISGIVPPPHFNVRRGLFDAAFTLHLSCDLPGATIRFRTDGTEPTASTGTVYSGPMEITNTTVMRAIATKPGMLPSATVTHTYLFLEQVVSQPSNPVGFPTNWGFGTNIPNVGSSLFSPGTTIAGMVPADYEMDMDPLRVNPNDTNSAIDAVKLQRLKDGLRELPVVSIVMKTDDLFGVNGLYQRSANETGQPNKPDNRKPCSVEMILPDGTTAFTTTCGIDLHGNASRNPIKNPKHGFKLKFRGDYGPPTLQYRLFEDSGVDEYDDVLLRADFNSSWRHWSDSPTEGLGALQRTRGTRTRDAWMKKAMLDMGGLSSHSRFVHLYLNGLYWGTYDLSEDPTEVFAKNNLGGNAEDFDVIDQGVVKNGTRAFYDAMTNLPAATTLAQYQQYQQYLNVTEYVDYMLLHFFIGHHDWATSGNQGTKNWSAIRKRVAGPEGTFRFIPWDGECILLDTNVNRTTVSGIDYPAGLHGDLDDSPEYRLLFADRVHRHMIAPDGALTRGANIARWQKWQAVMDKPIVAESVRWGDYRRDVHRYQNGTYQLYTREEFWVPENARMLTNYFPNRTDIVLGQLRAVRLYPSNAAPVFSQHGGRVARNFNLSITATNPIYYTLDGSDPREFGTSAVAAGATPYTNGPIVVSNSIIVKARALFDTNWSALVEAAFQVAELGPPIRITELMYNPAGGSAYEYLILKNVGVTTLNLGGYYFDGIGFVFAPNTILSAGAAIVLASNNNPTNWAGRYPSMTAFGYFTGNLNNDGEKISILDPNNNIVYSLDYNDADGWVRPGALPLKIADVLGDPDDAANWYAGTPPATTVTLNEVMADNISAVLDGTNYPDWVELHNSGPGTVNIGGWSLTDDSDPRKYVFPPNTSIPAGEYLVVWCDLPPFTTAGLHTGFALDRDGETVSLFNATTTRVDAVTFGLQLANYSIGRTPEGWKLNTPTTNAANTEAATAPTSSLAINEWMAKSPPGQEDWIELYNRSSSLPVALQGIFIGTANASHQLSPLSFIGPAGFVQLFASEGTGVDQLDFKLTAEGETIILYDESAIEIERVTFGPQLEGVTQGRLPDGTATIATFTGSASPGTNNYVISYTGPRLNEIAAALGWVELHNTNGTAFDLSGMSLSTDLNEPAVWVFTNSISGNGYLVVPLGDLLDDESGEVHLLNAGGQVVDSVVYGFQIEDKPIGRNGNDWILLDALTPGNPNAGAAELGLATALRLNEWMSNPAEDNDWFEIYNGDSRPVALAGLYVTDDPSIAGLRQFQFHALSFIGGNGFVRVVADADPSDGRNHVNFALAAEGESLRLVGTDVIDTVYFGGQEIGVSEGRVPDGGELVASFPTTGTPRASNYLPLENARINEVLAHPQGPAEQAIEIYNPSSLGADIGGWYLSNHPRDHKRYRIPNGTFLPAGGYLLFQASQLGFAFNGYASLSEADSVGNLSGRRSVVSFAQAPAGKSFGAVQHCYGLDFAEMNAVTLGAFNSRPRVGPVLINEIMYHPPTLNSNENNIDEYIELHNETGQAVALDGWQLRDAVNFTFPTNTSIPPFGFLLVVSFDPEADIDQMNVFRSKFGVPDEVALLGPWRGNLSNGGEALELYRPGEILVERVVYDDIAPWPTLGDGDGNALQRNAAQPFTSTHEFGNDAFSWYADSPSAGISNAVASSQAPVFLTQPISRAVPPGTRVEFNVALCGTLPIGYLWEWDGGFPPDRANSSIVIESATVANAGTYRVAVSNQFSPTLYSTPATLIILSPPVITQQPQPIATASQTNVSFSVGVSGSGPFTYQWRRNGIPLSGETNATLEFPDVKVPDSGDYSVLVANASGTTASTVARLQVYPRVRIVTHPQSRVVNTNTAVSFSVTVTGGGGSLRYQWRYMGQDIPGATGPTLDLTAVQLDQSGQYSALVYDDYSSEESLPATLVLNVSPAITRHPLGLTVAVGSNVTISAGVVGGWPITNRWRRGAANVATNVLFAKDTNSIITIPNIQTNLAGGYNVGAFNHRPGVLFSSNAYITVVVPPTNTTALSRTDARITVRAVGITPIRYQWKAGGTDILGATNATLTLSNVQMSQAGPYSVVVSAVTNTPIAPATFSADLIVEPGPPLLSAPSLLPTGEFQFSLTGDSNETYAVQYSLNLSNWTTFTNVPYTSDPLIVTDPAAGSESRKFYRAFKQ